MSHLAWTVPPVAMRPRRASIGAVLRMTIARVAVSVSREWRIRRDQRLVETLDDRLLADIGLGRGGLEDVVRHGRFARTFPVARPRPREAAPLMPASWTEWR